MASTIIPFTPSASANFQFQCTLDGAPYNVICTFNAYAQRFYVNIYDLTGTLVLSRPLIGSPSFANVSLTLGYFETTMIYRESSQVFEIPGIPAVPLARPPAPAYVPPGPPPPPPPPPPASPPTWTAGPTLTGVNYWGSITYANGVWIAECQMFGGFLGYSSSPDGVTWSTPTFVQNNFGHNILPASSAYQDGVTLFTSDGFTTNAAAHSSNNGVSWSPVNSWPNGICQVVAAGNGHFVVSAGAGDALGAIQNSPDGINFTSRSVPSGEWGASGFGDGVFVLAALDTGHTLLSSDNGNTWVAGGVIASSLNTTARIAFGNGTFVASQNPVGGQLTKVSVSSDLGVTWSSHDTPSGAIVGMLPGANWYSIEFGLGYFLTVSNDGQLVGFSTDGVSWSSSPAMPSGGTNWVLTSNGVDKWVAISSEGHTAVGQ